MCDDSSSEDEITKRILEDSIDTELLTNDLFADSSTKRPLDEIKSVKSLQKKPSLRYIVEDDGHDHNFIKVTPEFQEYVAKNLFKHLENQIIEKKSKRKKYHVDSTDSYAIGIRLFNGSDKLIDSVMDEPTIKRKRYNNKSISDKLILERASETAVSPEWILNKDAVQGWAKISKGKIIKVKRNNEGTFDVIDGDV